MIVIRPIALSDLNALHQIAINSGHGLTSLPDDINVLRDKIKHSLLAFSDNVEMSPAQSYLFVMEDIASGNIIGTSGIESCVGITTPLYHHQIINSKHHLKSHNLSQSLQTLNLGTHLTGCSEICALYLSPEYRKNGNGRVLSRSRFLFMADRPTRFAGTVIAEMRGYTDDSGSSPFWDWFQQHFCNINFETSNQLISNGDMSFIEELMPQHPIYTHLLSDKAQHAINRVHDATQPAVTLLKREHFSCGDYIGVNDAGPAMLCELQKIKTVVESSLKTVHIGDSGKNNGSYLVSNSKLGDYRAGVVDANINANLIVIDGESAHNLRVSNGDQLRIITH